MIYIRKLTILWISPIILDIHFHKTTLLYVTKQLAEFNHEIHVIAVRSRNISRFEDSKAQLFSVPLRYVPLISPIIYAVILFFFLPIFALVAKPDFIIMEPDVSVLSSLPGLVISKFKKLRFILDVRSVPVETKGFRGLLRSFWFSVSVAIAKRLFDGMTIITSLMNEEVCNWFNMSPQKSGIWSTGVSESLFNPENFISERNSFKKSLGLSEKFVVFHHGIFTDTRGLTEAVEAMRVIRTKYPRIILFLLGTGPLAPKLKDLIRSEGVQDNVVIHKSVDLSEVPKFISICDVGIVPLPNHPYWRYQCPTKLLEYMAMKKPVIVTDIPAHRLVIGKEKCGIYIPSVKPTKIAEAIEYAYHNKEKLEEWGNIGRAIIMKKYTWEKVARDLEYYLLSIDCAS